MSNVNKAILVGRVGKDPDVRQTPAGLKVCNFSLATSKKVKGEDQTQWHRITAYDKIADIISQYVRKGSLLYIEGEIKYGKYTNRDGIEQNTTDIVVHQVQMIGPRPQQEEVQRHPPEDEPEDLPF